MKKYPNLEVIVEILTFIIMAAAMIYLVKSNKYLMYVTPKMKPFLYFTACGFGILALCQIPNIFQAKYQKKYLRYCALLIPVLLFMVPRSSLKASASAAAYNSSMSNGDVSDVQTKNVAKQDSETDTQTEESSTSDNVSVEESTISDSASIEMNSTGGDSQESSETTIALEGMDEVNKTITISDADFYDWVCELYANVDTYEGYTVTMKGMVYHDDSTMESTEFATVRLAMVCCAADMVPCGPMCIYDNAPSLTEDAWITITGIIHAGTYEGTKEPEIDVTNVETADAPKEEYLYPYGGY